MIVDMAGLKVEERQMGARSLLVRHAPASAGEVRHMLAADLRACGVTEGSIDDAVLVASELLGNAIVHAQDGATAGLGVTWEIAGDGVTIHVYDHSDAQPEPRRAGPTSA